MLSQFSAFTVYGLVWGAVFLGVGLAVSLLGAIWAA